AEQQSERSIPRNCLFLSPNTRRSARHRAQRRPDRPRPDCRESHHRYTPPTSCYFERMVEVLWVVEDSLTGIAGDDLVVLANLLKYLGPYSHLTDFANIIASSRHRDSAPCFSDAFVARQNVGGNRGFDLPAFLDIPFERVQFLLVFSFEFLPFL